MHKSEQRVNHRGREAIGERYNSFFRMCSNEIQSAYQLRFAHDKGRYYALICPGSVAQGLERPAIFVELAKRQRQFKTLRFSFQYRANDNTSAPEILLWGAMIKLFPETKGWRLKRGARDQRLCRWERDEGVAFDLDNDEGLATTAKVAAKAVNEIVKKLEEHNWF